MCPIYVRVVLPTPSVLTACASSQPLCPACLHVWLQHYPTVLPLRPPEVEASAVSDEDDEDDGTGQGRRRTVPRDLAEVEVSERQLACAIELACATLNKVMKKHTCRGKGL